MTVPLSAVNYDGGIPYVYCLENGVAVRTDVEVGIHDEERIEILGGLEDGSQVIYSWSNELVDGAEVILKGASAALEEDGGSDALEGEGRGASEEADDAGREAGEDA